MKDLKQIKKNINIANAAKSNTWNYWSVDTVWIEKAIHFNQLGNLNSAISFFATGEKDVNFDTNFAMEEAKKDKKRLKVYTTLDLLKNEIPDIFVDKSEFLIRFSNNNGKIGLDIAEKLYGKRIDDRTNEEYKWKSYMVTTNILFKRIDDYNIELNDANGKIILSRKVIINGLQSETISLPKGVSGGLFLVKISDTKGKNYFSEKIIVQ